MKLFSRTSSPLSLESPRNSPLPSLSSRTRTRSTLSTTTTQPPTPPPSSPPRRPRLRHGAPPFLEGWAGVRASPSASRKTDLRFCTLAGPSLRFSASPSHDVLTRSACVYGASVSAEEFPTLKITLRPADGGRVTIFAESRKEHLQWVAELTRASRRCLTDVYNFCADLRDGGFGRVSAAVDRENGVVVDVKVASKASLSAAHVSYARIEAAVLLAMPEHMCIPRVVDVYESARTVYLVTDHLPGRALGDVVAERGAICEAEVACVVRDVLRAIAHAHKHGVMHRMVCADNVVVNCGDGAGAVRGAWLCNFELAVAAMDVDDAPSVQDCISGTGPLYLRHAMYLAPEVARDTIGDYAQDVWSVGVLMHYLLVGCTPFDHGVSNLSGLMEVIGRTKGTPSFSGPLWRGVTSGAKHLCASLLHADAGLRVRAAAALGHPWLNV